MKKKLLTLALAALLVCGALMSGSLAETQGLYEYTVKEDGTAEITKVDQSIKDGNIPAELDGHKVTSIGRDAFYSCRKLTSVTVPEGVTAIGGMAFGVCDRVKTVSLPEGLVSIANSAFTGCSALQEINIPESLTDINEGAFMFCPKLATIRVSPCHPVYTVSCKALINKQDMTMLLFTDTKGGEYEVIWGIRRIGAGAFSSSKLAFVRLPYSVTEIGDHAFADCNALKEITLPESVKAVEMQAFFSCNGLRSLIILNDEADLGGGLVDYCKNVTVKGHAGSAAEKYCKDNSIKFEELK